jgi:hypothetical protein
MFYNVEENFLNSEEFEQLTKQTINNPYFPLYLKHRVASASSDDGIYFTHNFFFAGEVCSDYYEHLSPIIEKIKTEKLLRVQLNLFPKTTEIVRHDWHTDMLWDHRGCIVYLNTNDGSTLLKEDDENAVGIRSISNRALFFNPAKPHCSTTCTDSEFRSNIIFNYE